MNKLSKAYENKKAFIPFITAGDPCLEVNERLVIQMADAGAELIELGMPFLGPVAEGPAIQRADERALAAGATTHRIFDMARHMANIADGVIVGSAIVGIIEKYNRDCITPVCEYVRSIKSAISDL